MRWFLGAVFAAVIGCGLAAGPGRAEPAPATDAPSGNSSGGATTTGPSTAAAETPSAPVVAEPAPARSVSPVAAETPPPPPAHPVIAVAREKLAGWKQKGLASQVDALRAFYADFQDPPLWVTADGFTSKAEAMLAEIRKAEDWGLSAAAFDVPAAPGSGATPEAQAEAEIKAGLAALHYANHARGGRIDPPSLSRMLDRKPNVPEAGAVIRDLAKADNPAGLLRAQHPKHRQFELLRQALLAAREPETKSQDEKPVEIPAGPNLKPGAAHEHIALLRQRLKIPAEAGAEKTYDDKLAQAVKALQKEKGLKATGILTNATRNALNGPKKPTRAAEIQRLLVNMERWRWLPETLGDLYVWDNVPEFMMSVVKKGEVIHSEKIVVGKPDTPTPMFSADMRYVVFHPEWGVPESIKVKEIWPSLRGSSGFFGFGGGSTQTLRRHNLRVSYNGRSIDPDMVDWNSVDIRRYSFTQPAGATNVLGVVKFLFPNKHDVYMHDTPQRFLFSNDRRAFSHGCMRVQNPRRLAEILLAEDQGLTPAQVGEFLNGTYNHEVTLKTLVPVHVNYFTAVAGEDGKVRTFGDLYGQDSRLAAALEGRPVPVADDGYVGDNGFSEQVARAKPRKRRPSGDTISDMVTGLFGN